MGVDEAKKTVDDTLNTELSSKGFLVASYDKILTWARTGESIQIPASKRPKFTVGKALKDSVNN